MHRSLAIVGAGRVARALGRRLRELRWHIGSVISQTEATARRAVRFIGGGHARAGLSRQVLASRVILIAVPDSEISSVAQELARIGGEELKGKIVLHTSGALSSAVLQPLRAHGASAGSMHPLQSFSGVGVPPLEGKVFALEGDLQAVKVARQIARALGGTPVQVAGANKALYHAAAAMAAGQVLAIVESATEMLISIGMRRREATRALLPLSRQVLENFERIGPKAAWTGPLARGDYSIIATHRDALSHRSSEEAAAYDVLNRLAARVLAQESGAVLAELERIEALPKAKATSMGSKT